MKTILLLAIAFAIGWAPDQQSTAPTTQGKTVQTGGTAGISARAPKKAVNDTTKKDTSIAPLFKHSFLE